MNWKPNKIAVDGFDSDDGNYRILRARNGKWRLVSFVDEDDDGDMNWWDFSTVEQAKEFAENL